MIQLRRRPGLSNSPHWSTVCIPSTDSDSASSPQNTHSELKPAIRTCTKFSAIYAPVDSARNSTESVNERTKMCHDVSCKCLRRRLLTPGQLVCCKRASSSWYTVYNIMTFVDIAFTSESELTFEVLSWQSRRVGNLNTSNLKDEKRLT